MSKNLSIIAVLLLICKTIFGQHQCTWNTFSIGSGNIADAIYRTQATAGQTAIGKITSSNMMAFIGFWLPVPFVSITEPKGDVISPTLPLVTKLYYAQPNPFKTLTTIRYSLSAETKTSLMIYDINGRLVKTLLDEIKQPGIYTINWNGRNACGQKVSSGIYFYKLQTTNYSLTRKILLIE